MGKGDRRSKRGKLFRGTFGKTRSQRTGDTIAVTAPKKETAVPEKPAKKTRKKAAES